MHVRCIFTILFKCEIEIRSFYVCQLKWPNTFSNLFFVTLSDVFFFFKEGYTHETFFKEGYTHETMVRSLQRYFTTNLFHADGAMGCQEQWSFYETLKTII